MVEALFKAIQDKANHIAICDWVRFKRIGNVFKVTQKGRRESFESDPLRTYLMCGGIPVGSVLWPRSLLEKHNGWNEALRTVEDVDIFTRFILNGVSVIRADAGTMYYRDTPGSVSKQDTLLDATGLSIRLLEELEARLRCMLADYRGVCRMCWGTHLFVHRRQAPSVRR